MVVGSKFWWWGSYYVANECNIIIATQWQLKSGATAWQVLLVLTTLMAVGPRGNGPTTIFLDT